MYGLCVYNNDKIKLIKSVVDKNAICVVCSWAIMTLAYDIDADAKVLKKFYMSNLLRTFKKIKIKKYWN